MAKQINLNVIQKKRCRYSFVVFTLSFVVFTLSFVAFYPQLRCVFLGQSFARSMHIVINAIRKKNIDIKLTIFL